MTQSKSPAALYLELTKPRLTLLALFNVLQGFYLGTPDKVNVSLLLLTLLGNALIGGGANAFNQYLEKDTDAQMPRTRGRPLPSGKMQPRQALIFAWIISAAGVGMLAAGVNVLAGILGLATLLSYVLWYTPLKKKHWTSTYAGGIPGALPPMIGWVAASGKIEAGACILFLILFLWQIPHFFAIGWFCREDYARAGFPVLPVIDPQGVRTVRQMIVFSAVLFPVSILPVFFNIAGVIYLFAAVLLGVFLLGFALALKASGLNTNAKPFFYYSIIYLFILTIVMMMDKV